MEGTKTRAEMEKFMAEEMEKLMKKQLEMETKIVENENKEKAEMYERAKKVYVNEKMEEIKKLNKTELLKKMEWFIGEEYERKTPFVKNEVKGMKTMKTTKTTKTKKTKKVYEMCKCRSWGNGFGVMCGRNVESGEYCKRHNKEMEEFGGICLGIWGEERPTHFLTGKIPKGQLSNKINWKNEKCVSIEESEEEEEIEESEEETESLEK